ncbi:class I SAM-dependent methyltransferase [Chryseomicrobium sp. FSL W7-1435]|uniref:class I SAM-dependent methyltransferase n=1 Tax=Chryseomicrobium sp. FSL W7-1435 TaxID=2921704 RepID=UPI00315A28C7
MKLMNPSTLEKWLPPHSLEWYNQLSKLQGEYEYSWDSTRTEPNGESNFDLEVLHNIVNKKVLDVGCGHGEFTIKCSSFAKEIVGFDATENFVHIGNQAKGKNVSFIVGNTKNGLPFRTEEFDFVYNRKGPTSAYPSISRVLKKSGKFIGLHPGDASGKELPILFPNLFDELQGTPILNTLNQRLESSEFLQWEVEVVNSVEYLHTPLDVVKMRCFGQRPEIYKTVKELNLAIISKVFNQNATHRGLLITFSRYIVRANV